ncbi:MAG: GxxExxY protein [Mariniphaga sp.]|jgi:GxxExxY protein|nr:GxxExxY protein [Mariniphaga sp.]
MKNTDNEDLTGKVIKAAYTVHNILGPGFQEMVYRNALAIELQEMGIEVLKEFPIQVYYKEHLVGAYFADLIIKDQLVIELKAIENLAASHEVQLVNYLAATRIEHGLLINFGSSVKVKHKFRTYKKTK